MLFKNQRGEYIFGTSDYDQPTELAIERRPGRFTSSVTIPGNLFKTETIYVTIGADIHRHRVIFKEEDCIQLDIIEEGNTVTSGRHQRVGLIAPLLHWTIQPVNGTELSSIEADNHKSSRTKYDV
jgi:hypothetical protein